LGSELVLSSSLRGFLLGEKMSFNFFKGKNKDTIAKFKKLNFAIFVDLSNFIKIK